MKAAEQQWTEITIGVLARRARHHAEAADRASVYKEAKLLRRAARHLGACVDEFRQDLTVAATQPLTLVVAAG